MSADQRQGEIVVTLNTEGSASQEATTSAAPSEKVEELERRADDLRNNLGALVGELGRRGQRALLPLAVGAAVLGVLGLAGALLWRRRQARKTRSMGNLAVALRRAWAHPERVARTEPRGVSKIAIAAGAAVASVVARRLAQRSLDLRSEPSQG